MPNVPTSTSTSTSTSTTGRGGKPFAPRSALLPVMRCKVWVDHAHAISSPLASTATTNTAISQYKIMEELNQVLTHRPKLFMAGEKLPKRTTSSSNAEKEQFKQKRAGLSLPDQLEAMFNQADAERQWGMLQYSESKREQGNEVRAAFNFYTQQLQFDGDAYRLTASQEDKKRMVRNDQLPSLTAVITSDLDLRDLYRNQFLTAMEDAQAEVAYQVKQQQQQQQQEESSQQVVLVDTSDVVDLMNQAHTACTKWFDLIATQDVNEALEVVLKE
jgi:hypothetical protein